MFKKIVWIWKTFLRKFEQENQNIASILGNFYIQKQGKDGFTKAGYKRANEDILSLGITDIKIFGNKITITLTRPGLLIGRRGENIDALKEYFTKELKKPIQIYIIENRVLGWLYPSFPDDFDYFEQL